MLFRLWFYACKIGVIGFALTIVGFATSWPLGDTLQFVGLMIVVLVCIVGVLLGIAGCFFGLRSACPICGTRSSWVRVGKQSIGLDCDRCGLVYGNPLLHFTPQVLDDSDEPDSYS